MSGDPDVVALDAAAAPPRANGELVFEEPWESRAFGIAVALHGAGAVDFEDFRARLIDEIRSSEGEHDPTDAGHRYYECWLRALERTLLARGVVDETALETERRRLEHEWAHDH
jgi:nitrile hydratase accessory protein